MNRKVIIIAIITIVVIVALGTFVFSNLSSNDSINIDAKALEDRGNLVVDGKFR